MGFDDLGNLNNVYHDKEIEKMVKDKNWCRRSEAIGKFLNELKSQSDTFSYGKWHFDKFKVVCVKCGSERVDVMTNEDSSGIYYEGDVPDNNILCKCADCGNALMVQL